MRCVLLGCLGLLVAAGRLSASSGGDGAFALRVELSETGVTTTSLVGCRWLELGFASDAEGYRVLITEAGVFHLQEDSLDLQSNLAKESDFAFVLRPEGNAFTATGLQGCRWSTLEYSSTEQGQAVAIITDRGVRGVATHP